MSVSFDPPLVGEVMVNGSPQPCYVMGLDDTRLIVVVIAGEMKRQIRAERIGSVLIDVDHLAERVRIRTEATQWDPPWLPRPGTDPSLVTVPDLGEYRHPAPGIGPAVRCGRCGHPFHGPDVCREPDSGVHAGEQCGCMAG